MSCKLIERYKQAEREIIDEEQGNNFELEYYLLISETDECEDAQVMKTYGIEITKKAEGRQSESKGFENINSDMERIKKIICMLADNAVTPISLPYILEDLLGI